MSTDHYLDCLNPQCEGCLPTDEEVAAMNVGQATLEAGRREVPFTRPSLRRQAILDDANDYRARSQAHRKELFP